MKDDLKAKFFHELYTLGVFEAQTAMESEQIESLQSRLLTIDPKSDVKFEYARVRGALEALVGLKAKRERLIEDHRSRLRNS